jgi:chorismate synthase
MLGALSSATASSFTFSINTQNRSDPIVSQTVTIVLEAMFTIAP